MSSRDGKMSPERFPMDISTLSSNPASIYNVLDATSPSDGGDGAATTGSDAASDDAAVNETPALAGSSNALQSLFALTQPATGFTANLVTNVVNGVLNAAPGSASTNVLPSTFGIDPSSLPSVVQPNVAFTGLTSNAAASNATAVTASAMASAGSTSTVNGDGSITTTTTNPDGSVSVETSAGSPTSAAAASSSAATTSSGVDDSYLAYLSLPSIPMDNTTDYSDGG